MIRPATQASFQDEVKGGMFPVCSIRGAYNDLYSCGSFLLPMMVEVLLASY
jgi:hypothetical protein